MFRAEKSSRAPYWEIALVKKNQTIKNNSPRQLAVKCLTEWERQTPETRQPLNNIASNFLTTHKLTSVDTRLFWELITGTVRHLLLLDYHIESNLTRKKAKLPLKVKNWLRIGAYQILFLDRIPPFAAVNETVKGLKKSKAKWAAGLANAVLRKIAKSSKNAKQIENSALSEIERISIETSHPKWMVEKWIGRYGLKKTITLCNANNSRPPLTLRVNTLKITREKFMSLLKEAGIEARQGLLSPDAIIIDADHFDIKKIPGFSKGLFQVQDESSQLVAHLLNPKPDEKILDMCAGLGGKTTHLAALMQNQGEIVASDTNKNRLTLLKENCIRLGIKNVQIVNPDLIKQHAPYDKVVVDAPCIGLGVIRRHPDIKWNRFPKSILRMAELQASLLEQALGLLKPGGILAYSVCSIEPEEGKKVVEKVSNHLDNFAILDVQKLLPQIEKGPYLELLPQEKGPDGFFTAILKKN